jgi:hypothetical protein
VYANPDKPVATGGTADTNVVAKAVEAPKAAPRSGGYFGPEPNAGPVTSEPALDARTLAKVCRCGNTRREHAGERNTGACTEVGCPCMGFEAR